MNQEKSDGDASAGDEVREHVQSARFQGTGFVTAAHGQKKDSENRIHGSGRDRDREAETDAVNLDTADERLRRFDANHDRSESDQSAFERGREKFNFSMTVRVIAIGGLLRQTHHDHGKSGRDHIDDGFHRI